MGGDIGQQIEWNHDQGFDWYLLDFKSHHASITTCVIYFNCIVEIQVCMSLIVTQKALNGLIFMMLKIRLSLIKEKTKILRIHYFSHIFNFTPVNRETYRVGVPFSGRYEEILNSDSEFYGGSQMSETLAQDSLGNLDSYQPHYLDLTIPPLGYDCDEAAFRCTNVRGWRR